MVKLVSCQKFHLAAVSFPFDQITSPVFELIINLNQYNPVTRGLTTLFTVF